MPTTASTRKTVKKTLTPDDRKAARLAAINDKAEDDLTALAESVTQGEWLAIRRALDMTRPQIGAERTLVLLALAYVKEKRDHGAASWEVLLDMTDDQIAHLHGFRDLDDLEDEDAPAEADGD